MVLDMPTLSVAVMMVMVLSSLALLCNWLANRFVEGLLHIAVGIVLVSFGTCVFFDATALQQPFLFFFYQLSVLIGHTILWLGVADFWQMRTKLQTFGAWGLGFLASAWLLTLSLQGEKQDYMIDVMFLFVGIISIGIALTFLKALGGHQGLYKGIIKRATIGASIALLLFVIHALYGFYHVTPTGLLPSSEGFFVRSIAILAHLEPMVFSMLFAFVVIIMTAERLQAELKFHEMMDPLTKALKQRAFLEVVKAVLARARRNAEPVSLIMMDIDQFKKINTQHSRAVGDAALSLFADMVMEGRRGQDVFCRFGGEEFVLLLPGTAEEGVQLVADRIREKLETTVLEPRGVPITLTISLGFVTARGDDLDADGMLDVVNRQMYQNQKLNFQKIHSAS